MQESKLTWWYLSGLAAKSFSELNHKLTIYIEFYLAYVFFWIHLQTHMISIPQYLIYQN